ncbi:unnamed protein product, partial [Rotaria magnacalcarata]
SQQWIEYYRSIGQGEYADEIARQMKAIYRKWFIFIVIELQK